MSSSRAIIEGCVRQGVRHFCLGVGARGAPLVAALSEVAGAECHVHFDERGMSFLALGLAKATGEVVGVVTTSGSAVGNVLPAVMEADAEGIPLVVLTADRPFELQGCGTNQTCDQVRIFGTYVREAIDLPIEGRGIERAVAHAVWIARNKRGPVHINCPMREPFFPLSEKEHEARVEYVSAGRGREVPLQLPAAEKGVVIAGRGARGGAIVEVARRLKWPLLTDCLSELRCAEHITHFNHFELPEVEAILHFGDRLVSKRLLEWIARGRFSFYAVVGADERRYDPVQRITHRVYAEPEGVVSGIEERRGGAWLSAWEEMSLGARECIRGYFDGEEELSEPGLFHFLQGSLPREWSLFVGNSMPIRDADSFFFPPVPQGCFMANRGVSGIDGNIATLVGLSLGRRAPLLGVIGDLTALHDLNSLALIKQAARPIVLIIINNGGGGIFSFLPIAKQTELFESHFAAVHDLTFEHAAKLFDIPYANMKKRGNLEETLSKLFETPRTMLIELETVRAENYEIHKTIEKRCRQNSSSSTDSWDAKRIGMMSFTT